MNSSTRQHTVVTSHGSLAVEETGKGGTPGLIAFDLPGHGQSSNAPDPTRTYTLPGLADAALESLDKLAVREAIVFGWSLGGHIAIEMMPRFPGMRGLLITGTPPVGRNSMAQSFNASPSMGAAGKQDLSKADIDAFVQGIFGASAAPCQYDAVARTDGHFRKRLFEAARAGAGATSTPARSEPPCLLLG